MSSLTDAQIETVRAQIYRWARRLLRNHEDALDATQSVLIKALVARQLGAEKQYAWLRRVTINHCIDQLRKRRETAAEVEDVADGDELAAVESEERSRIVASALRELTEPQRLILLAKTYDEETFASIAATMDLSVSTVKTHYVRALRKMRDILSTCDGVRP